VIRGAIKINVVLATVLFLISCQDAPELVESSGMNEDTFSDSEKVSNRGVILERLSSYSEAEIKDCVAAMETAESFARKNPDSGLDFSETQNQRLFWMKAMRQKTGEDLNLQEVLSSSNFHLGQAKMSREDSAEFQDSIAKGCVIKMANALRDVGVSTGYEE